MLADAEGDAVIATCGLLTSTPKLSQRVFRELNLISTSPIDVQIPLPAVLGVTGEVSRSTGNQLLARQHRWQESVWELVVSVSFRQLNRYMPIVCMSEDSHEH